MIAGLGNLGYPPGGLSRARRAGVPYTGSVDATSGKPVPASAAEWTNFIASRGLTLAVPDYLHLCQEASGNLAGTISAFTLTATNSPAYQQAVTGWSRKGVKGDGSTVNMRFINTGGPNPSTTSFARFMYVLVGTLDGTFRYICANGTSGDQIGVSGALSGGSHVLRVRNSGNIATGTVNYQDTVVALLALHDVTGSRTRLYTQSEKLSPTFAAGPNTTNYTIGALGGTWANATVMYEAGWSGAGAEISDANAKAFLQGLGYSPGWS